VIEIVVLGGTKVVQEIDKPIRLPSFVGDLDEGK
jgi:hypothetical protein